MRNRIPCDQTGETELRRGISAFQLQAAGVQLLALAGVLPVAFRALVRKFFKRCRCDGDSQILRHIWFRLSILHLGSGYFGLFATDRIWGSYSRIEIEPTLL